MTIRVAQVPYLHVEPFYYDMERRGLRLIEMVPSTIGAAVDQGMIDAGPIPLVDSFRLEASWQPVSGFGVACVQGAGSALLYSAQLMENLDGGRIAVTDEAATAGWLLRILLRQKYHVHSSTWVTMAEPHDAFLVIGNQGLRQRFGAPGFPHRYDLGSEWHDWTGLPCVFSRWMSRRDLDPGERALLEDTLYVGLEDGVNALYEQRDGREDLLMLPRDIVNYIQGYRHVIRRAEHNAIDQFRHYVEQLEGE